jgi:signal transduction histidine kinase
VITSPDFGWSVVELGERVRVRGCKPTAEALNILRRLGVKAAISARLDDPVHVGGPPFGTLAYYFRRPNRFSWRDVTLFLAFCKRAADALALAAETAELYERNRLIENQSSNFTQAEVATLLVHDIAHKVFHVGEHGEKLIEDVKKQIKNYRTQFPPELLTANDALQNAIRILQQEVQDLRVIGRLNDADSKEFGPSTFSLRELVEELIRSMTYPLDRYGVSTKIDIPRDLNIFGAKRVLYHVLLNLLLNSIDAIRGRGRSAVVHITAAAANKEFIRLKFWDTGPGINLSRLTSASEIFKIGKTTKEGGSGLGLPMARNLVARYFNGELRLIDTRNAVFEIDIRRNNE